MTEDLRITALYAAITEWADVVMGARDIAKLPGLWYGRTRKIGNIGPFDVRINGHDKEVEGIPPFGIKIGMDDYFPGLIGLIGPTDGALMRSPVEGEDEDGIIAHFKAQATALEAEAP